MELSVMHKIKSDKKHYDYLRTHSYWYKYLNRDPNNYKEIINSYKKYSRETKTNKFSDTINSIDMVANILKTLE